MADRRYRIRTLIVDDSTLFREALKRELSKDRDIDVVALAADPFEARDRIMEFDPDIMVSDISMPKMNGVDFISRLMLQYPIPTVVVSSNAEFIKAALRAGAVGGVEKPGTGQRRDFGAFVKLVAAEIRAAMKKDVGVAAKMKAGRANANANANANAGVDAGGYGDDGSGGGYGDGRFGAGAADDARAARETAYGASHGAAHSASHGAAYGASHGAVHGASRGAVHGASHGAAHGAAAYCGSKAIIAIGASTGGTDAIAKVVSALPASLPGIVIVQHMPAEFTGMFSARLNSICAFPVREAKTGDRVLPGTALVAPGDYQFKVVKGPEGVLSVTTVRADKVSGHCPSVDFMFSSVASCAGSRAIGVILTGMGHDGADGLLEMRRAGACTIGQDERSCIVYGMPKVAYEKGGVQHQLPLEKIAAKIMALI
jgi:two-component system chemotaxis response regulator CheB